MNIWGNRDIMVMAAHRYCLGRMTYIVSECVEWLIFHWKNIEEDTRHRIITETKEAIERGHAGHECDVELWKKLIKMSEENAG